MPRLRPSSLFLAPAQLAASVSILSAQEPFANTHPSAMNLDVAANPGVEDMYIHKTPGAPFTGKSAVTWSALDGSSSHVAFVDMVARDSSGRLYTENRRRLTSSGEPQPKWRFAIIDPKAETRTTCYISTSTCRIDAFSRTVYDSSRVVEDLPRAFKVETVSLGTQVVEALTLDGTRTITSVAEGAYNNAKPLLITRDVWHSPDLDLDVVITKTDPRSGKFTRQIEILSRSEPDSEYFTIPAGYTIVDNRPTAKKNSP